MGCVPVTTVVASVDHGCMAADQRVTSEGAICHVSKIVRIGDELYGIAGEVMPAFLFLEWVKSPKRKRETLHKMIDAEHRSNFSVLVLSDDGLSIMDGWGVKVPLLDESYGIGSGAAIALSHLRRGMKPWEAIGQSPELDEGSGLFGDPQVEFLVPQDLRGR